MENEIESRPPIYTLTDVTIKTLGVRKAIALPQVFRSMAISHNPKQESIRNPILIVRARIQAMRILVNKQADLSMIPN